MATAAGENYTTFAGNRYGVLAKPIDFSAPDAPTSKTYHGITIVVEGNVLGRVQSWDTTGAYARGGEHVYELNNRTWGKPVDYVPGRWEGLTIAATVAELWDAEIEAQVGITKPGSQISDLIEQNRPFTAHEFWFRNSEAYRIWTYRGCWLTDRNEAGFTHDGNARVIANFNFSYVSRQLSGSTATPRVTEAV